VSPFLVRGALATGALADDELRDAMRYMGMRDIDADRLVRVGQALALAPFKQKLLAEIEKAYESGNISAQQFNDDLAQLDLPDGADALVRKTTEYRKLQRLDDKYRSAVSTAYSYGLISDVDYLPAMQQFGVGEDDARAQYAVDSYRKHGREALAAAKALTQAERRLQREAIRLAEDQYLAGAIDETALTAALIAVGLGAAEAALLLGQAVTRRSGRLRLTYGQMLEPDQALELREQVGAIRAQIVKQLIDAPSALAQLKTLKIPNTNANALVAAWAAQAFKEILPL
jgi:hypothetical protein